MPLVGNGKAFETDLVWPQAKSKYWTADKNEAGDKAFVFTTRNSANDNVVNSVTNTVALVNSPLWVMCVATAAKTVDTSKVGAYTLSYNVSDAAGNAATPVTRSVKVVAPVAVDTVAPVITLLGAASIEVEVGAVFTDPGATATDAVDGDLTNDIVVTLLDTSAPGINIPANKIGNGPDTTINTDDDVTVKGSYVVGDLTFVRPPVNLEAPAATWCPAPGCTSGNNTAKDAVRMGSNLGFRRMQFAEAEAWCAAQNGRLPTRDEITTHLVPIVGDGLAFESDLVWPQAKSKYWTSDKNAAGDKAFVFTTRNSTNDNVVNHVTNTVALVNSPIWVMCIGAS
jgi:hypothetical protein